MFHARLAISHRISLETSSFTISCMGILDWTSLSFCFFCIACFACTTTPLVPTHVTLSSTLHVGSQVALSCVIPSTAPPHVRRGAGTWRDERESFGVSRLGSGTVSSGIEGRRMTGGRDVVGGAVTCTSVPGVSLQAPREFFVLSKTLRLIGRIKFVE